MRRNSMCGMARSRLRIFSSLSSLKISASPPREKDVAHFGVLFQITERLLEIGVQFLFAHAAHDAAARAITAVARATIRHEKEDAIRITMHQARHRHVRVFPARIRHIVGRRPGLLDPRNHLPPNRAIRIVRSIRLKKCGVTARASFVPESSTPLRSSFDKFEVLLELGKRSDPIFQLPFPVVPEFRRTRPANSQAHARRTLFHPFCQGQE